MEAVLNGTCGRWATPGRENVPGIHCQHGVPFQMGTCADEGGKLLFYLFSQKQVEVKGRHSTSLSMPKQFPVSGDGLTNTHPKGVWGL